MTEAQRISPPKALLYPSAQVYEWGTTLIVSPYPDYQLLSCGGAIALLRQMGYRVHTLFLGDGRNSHCDKKSLSVATRKLLARQELLEAMEQVGICEEAAIYLHLYDGLFPQNGEPGFEEAVRLVMNELDCFEPDTVVLPMLATEQSDLLATWQILREALRRFQACVKLVEYALLTTEPDSSGLVKPTAEQRLWRLDVREVIDRKIRAFQLFQRSRVACMPALESIHPWETFLEYQS